MKRTTKFLICIIMVCLLVGTLFVSVASAAVPWQSLSAGSKNLGYLDFDAYSADSTYFDFSSVKNPSESGSKARVWVESAWKNDADIKVKSQTVDGRSNKYLNFAAVDGYTSSDTSTRYYALAPSSALSAPDNDGVANDFLVVDFDIRAEKYVVVNSDGTESTFYSSWDEVVAAGKESEAKLSYPEQLNFRINPSYNQNTFPVYIHSKAVETEDGVRQKTYLSVYALAGTYGQVELPNDLNKWNHVTIIYELKAASSQSVTCTAYLDGKYVGKYSKTGGASSYSPAEIRMGLIASVYNKSAPTYSFDLDNWTANAYVDYVPDENVKNSIVNVSNFARDYALYNCDDVVYNKNYLSPNGNSFDLEWQDLDGNVVASDSIAIGTIPTVSAELDDAALSRIKGDFKNIAAWEWNATGEYTPVSTLSMDMVYKLRAEGVQKVTLRPATEMVTAVNSSGEILGTDIYYKGSTVGLLELESNGWYSASYSIKENATEGEDKDSLVLVGGKENIFVVDDESAVPVASIDGVLYNMSLLTNYYMNIYMPLDTPDEVEFLGFYSDSALKYKHTDGIASVSVDGAPYERYSFEIANSDINTDLPQYIAIKVTLGGKAHTLAYEVKINLLSYTERVSEIYDCRSKECSLVINMLRYANEAYKYSNGEDETSAAKILSKHSLCGCLISDDAKNEHVGDPSHLLDYVYAATYSIGSQNPGMIIYLLADKAEEVTKITVEYKGIEKDVCVKLTADEAETVNGVPAIPYVYDNVSAADVNSLMTIKVYTDGTTPAAVGSYNLPTYIRNNGSVAVAKALYAFGKAANVYKRSVMIPNDSVIIEDITVSKESSLPPAMTVNPGEEIEYTISITNDGDEAVSVPVFDTVPANTKYISGDAKVEGYDLYWSVDVPAGETVSVTYKVRVNDDDSLIDGGCVIPSAVRAGGNEAECHENYIELTFGEVDEEFIKIGILANKYSGFKGTSLAKWIYNVAFTKNFTMSGDAKSVLDGIFGADTSESAKHREMVIPTLYGGSAVAAELDIRFKGTRAEKIDLAGLVVGDLLILEDSDGAEIYIYNGVGFISLTNGYDAVDTDDTLERALDSERYALLRPSVVMTAVKHAEGEMPTDLTDAQKALVETARAYVLRGYRLQYDDTRFDQAAANNAEYRWQIGIKSPEDYTSDEWGYINCAGFTYDIYLNALGHNLADLYTTSNLVWQYTTSSGARVEWDGIHGKLKTSYNGANLDYKMYPYFFRPTHKETAEEALEIEERIMSELQVGDLIVIRRYVNDSSKSDTGHVMMYIGNGKLVHSTGSNFKYSSDPAEETYEPTIRYMNVHDYFFNPSSSNYLFGENSPVDQFGIVRPLASSSYKVKSIPENTQNRINNMQGIVAEKLSSHKAGMTVSVGGEVTYTFRIFNSNDAVKTLAVTDVIPENASFVSLTGGGTYADGKLSWTVTVGAGDTVTVSYTVKATGEVGSCIYGTAGKVGGVLHKCEKVYIKRTLAEDEQSAIIAAIEYYRANNTENLSGLALAKAIYAKAAELLGKDSIKTPFDTESIDTLASGLVENKTGSTSIYQLKADGVYADMIAPTLYGGERLYTPNNYTKSSKACSDRTRLGMEHDLVVGDVLYGRYYSGTILYIYAGEDIGFVSLTNLATVSKSPDSVLVGVIGYYYYFVVLRPSQAW